MVTYEPETPLCSGALSEAGDLLHSSSVLRTILSPFLVQQHICALYPARESAPAGGCSSPHQATASILR